MVILIVGLGTIGEPLAHLFKNPSTYRSKLQEVLYKEPFLFEDEI